jgi:hypothetical protein
MVSRHEVETLARQHHKGHKLRKMSRWSQFVALSLAQLSDRSSLRVIVSNLSAQVAQIWIAICAYLLLAWIKFSSQADRSLQQMIRLLQLNLFKLRELLPSINIFGTTMIDNKV